MKKEINPITYFYKFDDKSYQVEARYPGNRIAFCKTVGGREEAIGLEKAIQMNPEKYGL